MIFGYDPAAIDRLEQGARRALAELIVMASSDSAAHSAMGAIARLRRALGDHLLPTVAALAREDPLGRWAMPLRDPQRSSQGRAPRSSPSPSRWSKVSNDELIEEVRDISYTPRTLDRPYGGLTEREFDELVVEFETRARKPAFADALIDELGTPLIGDIVVAGDFSRDVLVGVLFNLLASAPSYGREQVYRAAAIEQLLVKMMETPGLALDAISDAELLEWLLIYNSGVMLARISDDIVADFLLIAMVAAPDIEPKRRSDALRVFADLVDVAQEDDFDRGFPPQLAQAMSIIVGAHFDDFAPAAHHDCVIDLVGDDDRALGTRNELLGFFGTLVHDPTSRVILAGVLADAAHRAAHGTAPFDLVAVSAVSVLIDEAVNREDFELAEADRQGAAFFKFVFDLAGGGVTKSLKSLGGPGILVRYLAGFGLGKVENALIGRDDVPTTGAPNFAQVGDLIIRMQIIAHAVSDPGSRIAGASTADVLEAQRLVDATLANFSDPDATYADIQRSITRLEVDLNFILLDGEINRRVADARYVPRETRDSTDVCENEFPS